MSKKKKPSRWAPHNAIDQKDAEDILNINGLRSLSGQKWLDDNGEDIALEFNGILIEISKEHSSLIKGFLWSKLPYHEIFSVEFDETGIGHVVVEPFPDYKEDKIGICPVYNPDLIASLREKAWDQTGKSGKRYATLTGRAHHAITLATRSLRKRGNEFIKKWYEINNEDDFIKYNKYESLNFESQNYTPEGWLYDGNIKKIAGRNYAILGDNETDESVLRYSPLFSIKEIRDIRIKNGINSRLAPKSLILKAARAMKDLAAIERFKSEQPHAYKFLYEYKGKNEFIAKLSLLVKRNVALSEKQIEAVNQYMTMFATKERKLLKELNQPQKNTKKSPRLTVTIVSVEKIDKPNPFNPEEKIQMNRIVMRDSSRRVLIAKSTAYQANPGEKHKILFQKMREEKDAKGKRIFIVSQLHKLDDHKKLVKKKSGRSSISPKNTDKIEENNDVIELEPSS